MLFSSLLSIGSSLLARSGGKRNAQTQRGVSEDIGEIQDILFDEFKSTYPQAHNKYTNYVMSGGEDPNKIGGRVADSIDSDFERKLSSLESRLFSRGIDPSSPKFQAMSKNLLPQLSALKAKEVNNSMYGVQQGNINRLQSLSDQTFSKGNSAAGLSTREGMAGNNAYLAGEKKHDYIGGISRGVFNAYNDYNRHKGNGFLGTLFGDEKKRGSN